MSVRMPTMNYNRIKELLAKKGRANTELAAFLNVGVQTVSNWCRNISQPDLPTIFRIAEFLEVEVSELLTDRKDLHEVSRKKRA